MKCQKIQRWLSDSVDGEISQSKNDMIAAHIETCPACRDFRDQIKQISDEVRGLDIPGMSVTQSREFSRRLRSTIEDFEEKKEEGILHVFRNKWIFIPASLVLVSLFILIFIFYDRGDFQDEELYVLSFGKAVEEIYREIGDDAALQEEFNHLISASINEMLLLQDWEETLPLEDAVFLWEEYAEEETKHLDTKIKKERNS